MESPDRSKPLAVSPQTLTALIDACESALTVVESIAVDEEHERRIGIARQAKAKLIRALARARAGK